jgi:hypothetical protein
MPGGACSVRSLSGFLGGCRQIWTEKMAMTGEAVPFLANVSGQTDIVVLAGRALPPVTIAYPTL